MEIPSYLSHSGFISIADSSCPTHAPIEVEVYLLVEMIHFHKLPVDLGVHSCLDSSHEEELEPIRLWLQNYLSLMISSLRPPASRSLLLAPTQILYSPRRSLPIS